jgi:hypothetical protein
MNENEIFKMLTQECMNFLQEYVEWKKEMIREWKNVTSAREKETLTIPHLKRVKSSTSKGVSEYEKKFSDLNYRYERYLIERMNNLETVTWEEFFKEKKEFLLVKMKLTHLIEEYEGFRPANLEEIKNQVREILKKKKYIVDGYFEGDYDTWVGIYARPEDKPTYLDPSDEEEVALQNKYARNGFKQDFAEWFEWKIENGQVVPDDTQFK